MVCVMKFLRNVLGLDRMDRSMLVDFREIDGSPVKGWFLAIGSATFLQFLTTKVLGMFHKPTSQATCVYH